MDITLERFAKAQNMDFQKALNEIRNGQKQSHWMWYIFPQLKGLGHSSNSEYYGIVNIEEAKAFLNDAYLGSNIRKISAALLALECNDVRLIMGSPDDKKLKSSMTLFSVASGNEDVFRNVLDKFFNGEMDHRTLKMLGVYKSDKR